MSMFNPVADLRLYILQPADKTTCTACGEHPFLLAPREPNAQLPFYFMCLCGHVVQSGHSTAIGESGGKHQGRWQGWTERQ